MRIGAATFIATAIGLAACGFTVPPGGSGPSDATDATDADDAIDAPDMPPSLCFGSGIGAICLATLPTSPLALTSDPMFDTGGTGCPELALVGGVEMCVLSGTTVSVPAGVTFRGVGARPLFLVATDAITIDGTLSVSSLVTLPTGAGAGFASCVPAGPGITDASGGSGGAGGSFGGQGGAGGTGDTDSSPSAGGQPASAIVPTSVRAGCAGGAGGAGELPGGAGRAGGGAVYLVSRLQIVVNVGGGVYSVGRGGGGAGSRGGGGGGGSGGFIGFDAPTVDISGTAVANGAGGGEGARVQTEIALDGSDGLATMAAPGGDDLDPLDGPGGTGSAGSITTGSPGIGAAGGGGGGGGGAGYIYIKGARTGAGPLSPAAAITP